MEPSQALVIGEDLDAFPTKRMRNRFARLDTHRLSTLQTTVAKDQTLRENCALLERARADDPDRCKDAAVPALLRETRPRSRR